MKIQASVFLLMLAFTSTSFPASLTLDTERVWTNLDEVRGGRAGSDASASFAVPLSALSKSAVKGYIENRKNGDLRAESDRKNNIVTIENHVPQCRIVRAYANEVLKKIIAANKLEQVVATAPLELRFGLTCFSHPKWDLPTANQLGGTITVDIGMARTMKSEAALAAVIAHELAHFLRRHEIQLTASQEGLLNRIRRAFPGDEYFGAGNRAAISREAIQVYEKEADALGALLLERAGYPTEAAILGLNLSDERMTLNEKAEYPRQVDQSRRDLLADRMQTLTAGALITNHTPQPTMAPYPKKVSDALDFYFDLKNSKN